MYKILVIFTCFLITSCDLTDQVDTDCNGVHLGTAYIDDCGYCADGDTGRIPNANKDCSGECDGDKVFDECGKCDGNQVAGNCIQCGNDDDSTPADCNGNCPSVDTYDECGVCGGDNQCECPGYPEGTVKDCSGMCGGDAQIDECGICGGPGATGCDNSCGSLLEFDGCGECGGAGFIGCMCNYIPENSLNYPCDKSGRQSIYGVGDQISCNDADDILDICFPTTCNNQFSLADLYGKVTWIEMTSSW